jgi:uncharacterized membrane protein HdeD (DUF308 family)
MRPSASPPPPPPPEIEVSSRLDQKAWGLSILLGVLLVGLGVWMLANLVESVYVLALIIGVSLIVGGCAEAVLGRDRQGTWWGALIAGLLLVLTGLVVLAWPDITLWALTFAGGLALFLGGVVHTLVGLVRHGRPGWTLDLALGAIGIAMGGIVLVWPEATLVVVAILFGIRSVVTGLIAIAAGWELRRQGTASELA